MNIFYLDKDPELAAQYHCDKHVPKMIVETAQLLFTALWHQVGYTGPGGYGLMELEQSKLYKQVFYKCPKVYRPTHYNHPCAQWVRAGQLRFDWLTEMGLHLCKVYTLRFGKVHKTQAIFDWLLHREFKIRLPHLKFTSPPMCMPLQYQHEGDTVKSYRHYYFYGKEFISWRRAKRGAPVWVKQLASKKPDYHISSYPDSPNIRVIFEPDSDNYSLVFHHLYPLE